MIVVNESDIRIKLGTINAHGKEYYKLTYLICKRHFQGCDIKVNVDKKQLEVTCVKCDEEEKKLNNL